MTLQSESDDMNTVSESAYEGDIVSRLRNWRGLHLAHGGELFEEAADEIEALRKELAFHKRAFDTLNAVHAIKEQLLPRR